MFSCKEYKIVQSHKHPANSQKFPLQRQYRTIFQKMLK